jgi:hypothetical protein
VYIANFPQIFDTRCVRVRVCRSTRQAGLQILRGEIRQFSRITSGSFQRVIESVRILRGCRLPAPNSPQERRLLISKWRIQLPPRPLAAAGIVRRAVEVLRQTDVTVSPCRIRNMVGNARAAFASYCYSDEGSALTPTADIRGETVLSSRYGAAPSWHNDIIETGIGR